LIVNLEVSDISSKQAENLLKMIVDIDPTNLILISENIY